jgi:hypothetical protein
VALQHLWIDGCVANLRNVCRQFPVFEIAWKNKLVCFLNDDKTRTFLGLSANEATSNILSKVVGKVDAVFADYRLEKFYDPPLFHVSLFWMLGDHKELIETNLKLMKKIDLEIEDFLGGEDCHETVKKLTFKTGHKHFQIPLWTQFD